MVVSLHVGAGELIPSSREEQLVFLAMEPSL